MGSPLWTNRYNSAANLSDAATALAVSASGKVFVTGFSFSATVNMDYATVAYESDGSPSWMNRYGLFATGNSEDQPWAIAVNEAGTVFVTGASSNGTNQDIATIAYSIDGLALWTNRYDGPAKGADKSITKGSIAATPDGSLYVVGASDGSYASDVDIYDFATIKYEMSPRLSARRTGLNVEVAWDSAFLGWRLQSQVNGGLSMTWSNVSGSIFTNRLIFPATNAAHFFRLIP